MSSSNVELVLGALRAFERRDLDAIKQICAPDVEYDWSRRLLDPTVVRGYDGLRAFFQEIDGIFEEIVFTEEEILEFGNHVVVVSTGRFRGRTSGVDVTARAGLVCTIRDGKLARFRFYQSKQDALRDLASEGVELSAEPKAEAG